MSFLTAGRNIGTEVEIPLGYFLIEHPQGRLMFDTGANPKVVRDPENYPSTAAGATYRVREEDLAPNRLAEIGLRPEDVDLVANSHLHDDHAGGNICFSHATFLVQFAELQAAYWPQVYERENYVREAFDLPVHFEELDGDYDVFGDGTVTLIQTPGHSAGSQSLVVKLPETGTVVLAADSAYLTASLDELLVSTWVWDPRLQVRSFKVLRDYRRRENALVIPGHDREFWKTVRKAPDYYA
ncbi:N-acyl homoserine lactonase family protein [Gordonia asplenii]|nr:N-acyl homoserine lactonase family protein [Gordonia asplenii]